MSNGGFDDIHQKLLARTRGAGHRSRHGRLRIVAAGRCGCASSSLPRESIPRSTRARGLRSRTRSAAALSAGVARRSRRLLLGRPSTSTRLDRPRMAVEDEIRRRRERPDQRSTRVARPARVSKCQSVTAASSGRTWPKWRPMRRLSEDDVIDLHTRRDVSRLRRWIRPGFRLHGRPSTSGWRCRGERPRGRACRLASVAIAAGQTGIYPIGKPGRLASDRPHTCDAVRRCARRAVPVRPGDRVTFHSVASCGVRRAPIANGVAEVLRPGMLTTVQDLGRWGYQRAVCQWRDRWTVYSHRLANRLVGNRRRRRSTRNDVDRSGSCRRTAMSCVPSRVRSSTSPSMDAAVDTRQRFDLPRWLEASLRRAWSGRSRNARRAWRFRCAAGIRQPCDQPYQPHGSVRTDERSGGRRTASRARTVLPPPRQSVRGPCLPLPRGGARVRVIIGTPRRSVRRRGANQSVARISLHDRSRIQSHGLPTRRTEHCRAAARLRCCRTRPRSDRSRCRRSGQPILLMADRQTTGGYPQNRHRHHGRPAARRSARARRLDRLQRQCSRDRGARRAARAGTDRWSEFGSDRPSGNACSTRSGRTVSEAMRRSRRSPPSRLAARPTGW